MNDNDKKDNKRHNVDTIVLMLALVVLILLAQACTSVKYERDGVKLSVIDFHPAGSAISLEGVLNDTGSLRVNRDQGSVIDQAGDAVPGSTLGL